ncbi:hypothetical protein PFICI_08524 [Pestalotiopsis fici W106-1]|uniref:Uncharacterized protein n=1 Tax=Pestalotiopsis fici (strain W106-1 / CGMCC3.15140) TaxID=1229662 RepID=W3X0L0_PESFW|nr:uncharacterized protein PFICI_08524 [Pestalotiopsis fici W106-1]ETS78671.1 hypothetical protein PFICI_08524 [Pestalotiopsis fici W106-1]
MRSLLNKHAVITGGSRGIGLAIAHRFAAEGASVTLVGRDEGRLRSALDSLSASSPEHKGETTQPSVPHGLHAFDVGEIQGWGELTNKLKESKRPVDILVNAAGVTQDSLLFRGEFHKYQQIINTNLMGTIQGCGAISNWMIRQKTKGCIINVSSLLAIKGGRGASVYAASKAGIVGLTRSLATEIGQFGIRVNVLLPGYIQTEMTQTLDQKGNLSTSIPLGRFGTTEEVADAAAFLAKNPYAHNTVLNLDGGLSAT